MMINAYKILVRKPYGKRQIAKHRYRWEINIHMETAERDVRVRTGFSWLRKGISGGLFGVFLPFSLKLRNVTTS
jgi:hypothetical protein